MKSLVCPIGTADATQVALKEADTFAQHCCLNAKQTMSLRLLTEELLGMTGHLLDVHEGAFWIEQEGVNYRLCLTASAPVGEEARSRLLKASTTGTNTAYQGVTGRLCRAIDWLSGSAEGVPMPSADQGYVGTTAALHWSLEQYRQGVEREEKAQAWDELERSILAKLADDIRIGVRAGKIEITIFKGF